MISKNKIRKILKFSFFLILAVFAMILICETADARAGGGHSYSGGGGGSSGGGGGGGVIALIRLILFLIRLTIEHPLIGIPVDIIVAILLIYVYRTADDKIVDNTIEKGTRLYPTAVNNSALRKIKAKDLAFDEKDFCGRAERAFKIVQKAWSDGDLSKAEAFLGDGTYEQFLIQLKAMKENHIKDVMENLRVKSSTILGYESDNNFDTIYLGITASGKNYRADSRTGDFIEGDRYEEEFTEVWTFLRRTGTKTLKKPGLIEGYCPNCGAQISIGRHAKCASCSAILRSGEYDWVLANITQACEWSARSNASIPGVKRYLELDQGFNVQHIEDLVSVMFWRRNESERVSNVAPLRKIATNEYCDTQLNFYKPDVNGDHNIYTDCAVGTIKMLGVDNVTSDKDDYLYVKVIWSGVPAKRKRDGKIVKIVSTKQNIKEIFVLKRKHGVKTDTKTSLSSAHCPNCGAMTSDSLSNECEYCGSVLNDGKREWALEGVFSLTDERIGRALALVRNEDVSHSKANGFANTQSNIPQSGIKKNYTVEDYSNSMNRIPAMTMIKWTIAMMLADGVIDASEQEIINNYGQRRGISKSKIDELIAEIKAQPSPVDYVANSTDLPMDIELIRMLIRVAYADGKVTKEEIAMLKFVGKKLNISEEEIRKLLSDERMRLYRMSKAVIKESKNY